MENENEIVEVKRGRGRPKGSKNKTKLPAAQRPVDHQMRQLKKAKLQAESIGDGINARNIDFIIQTHKISTKANLEDVSTLYGCLFEFLQLCKDHDIAPTNMVAYSACRVNRQIVNQWMNGSRRAASPEYREFAEFIKNVCAESREILANSGKLNPILAIHYGKVWDGMYDDVRPAEEKKDPLGDYITVENIAEKYGASMTVDESEDE